MTYYKIRPERVIIDNFGVGANVAQEIALAGYRVTPLNVGLKDQDEDRFTNMRSGAYWRLMEWLKNAELYPNDKWKQLEQIKYTRELNGKIKIMSKKEMRHNNIASPDAADALAMTFARKMVKIPKGVQGGVDPIYEDMGDFY